MSSNKRAPEGELPTGTPTSASLVVCSTCRFSSAAREDAIGRTGGVVWRDQLEQTLSSHSLGTRLVIEAMPCLFACREHCTLFLRSPGRLGYLLGRFAPSVEAANALLDFASAYLDTEDGYVRYAHWPEGIKGHFIARVPPEGRLWPVGDATVTSSIS